MTYNEIGEGTVPHARHRRRALPKKRAKSMPALKYEATASQAASAVPPSSSTPDEAGAQSLSTTPSPNWKTLMGRDTPLGDDSKVREKALRIVAMRAAGAENDEIAKALKLSERTIKQYLYIAGKHGWLSGTLDPMDRLEYELTHKVVRNLNNALDAEVENAGGDARSSITLATAKGILFPKFEQQSQQTLPSMIIGVRIETVPGVDMTAREGTMSGIPNYIEGDVVKQGSSNG